MIPTTPPPAASTIIIVNLRTGTTVGGSLIDTVQFQFPVHSTPYGWNLTGMIPVIGFPPNTAYSLTFSTDGIGVATLTSSSWVEIVDMGPVSMASKPPAQPASVWTDLALQGGLTWRTSGHKPQYRLVGDEVQLRGLIDVAINVGRGDRVHDLARRVPPTGRHLVPDDHGSGRPHHLARPNLGNH